MCSLMAWPMGSSGCWSADWVSAASSSRGFSARTCKSIRSPARLLPEASVQLRVTNKGMSIPPPDLRRALLVEYLTIAWVAVEAAAGLVSGILAGSIALIGFGLDSIIELFAAAVVVW